MADSCFAPDCRQPLCPPSHVAQIRSSMADRVYLHVGAPKSGTTFIQTTLWSNQDRLRDCGILLPGTRHGDHNSVAVWARSDQPAKHARRVWGRVLDQIRPWNGSAIISSEWLTMVRPDLIPRFLGELAPAEVELIFTARSLASTVTAAWQERLKLGDALSLDEFIDTLDTTDNPRWHWGTLDPAQVLPRWEPHVPPERMHLVTVPPRGAPPEVLWGRFAGASSIPADACDLSSSFSNASLSAEGARLLQLIGPDLRCAVDADTVGGYLPYRWIRDLLSHQVLAQRPGSSIALRADELDRILGRAANSVAEIGRRGYDVLGEVDDLLYVPSQEGTVRPEEVQDSELLALALHVIPDLLGRVRAERERGDREAKRARRLAANSVEPAGPDAHPSRLETLPKSLHRPRTVGRLLRRTLNRTDDALE